MAKIDTTALINAVRFKEQSSDPSVPDENFQLLYVKSDGVYAINHDGTITGPLGTGGGGGAANTHATLWHDESTALYGASLVPVLDASQMYGVLTSMAAPDDGDTFTQDFVLAAGTYILNILGKLDSDEGILYWIIDGGGELNPGGQDWYSASPVHNNVFTLSGVVIASSGLHTLQAIVNHKNGSSSGYAIRITKMWFTL